MAANSQLDSRPPLALAKVNLAQFDTPSALLTYANQTHALFSQTTDADGLPTIFTDEAQLSLYSEPISTLFAWLRVQFEEITDADELVLSADALGISIAEDNIYSSAFSLAHLDHLHRGCGLPGRLHLTLDLHQRFSMGFNALVEHIAQTQATPAEAGDQVELLMDEAVAEDVLSEGQGEADDELADEEWHEGEEGLTTGDEADNFYQNADEGEGEDGEGYDLEEALAEMDSEDLEAVLDGATEDYIESEEAVYHAFDGDGEQHEQQEEAEEEGGEDEDGDDDVLLPDEAADELDVAEEEPLEGQTALEAQVVEETLEEEAPLEEAPEATEIDPAPALDSEVVQVEAEVARAEVEASADGAAEAIPSELESDFVDTKVDAEMQLVADELEEAPELAPEDATEEATEYVEEAFVPEGAEEDELIEAVEEALEPEAEAEAEAELEDSSRSITETLEENLVEPVEDVIESKAALEVEPELLADISAEVDVGAEGDVELLEDVLLSPKRARDEVELVELNAEELVEGDAKRVRLHEEVLILEDS